jgi:putative transposase
VVDTLGNLLAVVVHAANIQDRDGAKLVFQRLQAETAAAIKLIWAEQA